MIIVIMKIIIIIIGCVKENLIKLFLNIIKMEIIEIMEIIYKEFIDVDIYSQMEIKMMKLIMYIKEKNFILEIIIDKIKKSIIIII